MKMFKFLTWMCFLGCLFVHAGCGGSSSSSGSGSLSVYLTDVSSDDYQAVYVSIDEVLVHQSGDVLEGEEGGENDKEDGWQVVATPRKTFNLLDLVNGAMEKLGTSDLDSGRYTQMRLMLKETPDNGNNLLGQKHPYPHYIIDKEDSVHELTVPSGYQTGIKLVHAFEIVSGQTADLILDFDAVKSVVRAGKSGKYNLKPTIKVIGTVDNGIVSGTVTDAANGAIAGVSVSAQVTDPDADNPADRVIVATTTLTDENGNYSMYLAPGTYSIVAYKGADTDYGNAYGPECALAAVEFNAAYTLDFQLVPKLTGRVIADIRTGDEDVHVSFRQQSDCGAEGEAIEVIFLLVSEDGEYAVRLPGNDAEPMLYSIIASSGEETDSETAEVSAGEDAKINFDFSSSP